MTRFWVIWNDKAGPPTFKHGSKDAAEKEAERLARQCPGHTFHVLESCGSVTKNDVVWSRPEAEQEDDDPIF